MANAKEAVIDAVEHDRDYGVSLAQDLARIPTVNAKFQKEQGLNREADVRAKLAQELSTLGFETEVWEVFPELPNVIADLAGREDKSMILCGHVDVVPVGDAGVWKRAPFSGDLDDNRI